MEDVPEDDDEQVTLEPADSSPTANDSLESIPTKGLILIFAIIPALIFTAVGTVEDSFELADTGVLFDDSGGIYDLIEWEDRLYVFNQTNASSVDIRAEQVADYTYHPSGYLMLTNEFASELNRCPVGDIEVTCVITNNGLLEDPIFLGYFPAAAFTILAAGPLIRGMHAVRRGLPNLVSFEGDFGSSSQLSQDDFEEVDRFYNCMLLSILPWEKVPESKELSSENLKRFNHLRRVPKILSFLGLLTLYLGTNQHWTSEQTYGFDIWASSNFLLGFSSRLLYEAMIEIVFFPLIFYWLFTSIYLKHHALTRLEEKNGFKFIRFSHDEAGGMGEFGNQSLRNVQLILPLLIPILAYIIFYPVTPLLVIGMIAFVVGLPVLFFWPLMGARKSMIRMKVEEAGLLADCFEMEYYRHKMAILNTPEDGVTLAETGDALIRSEQISSDMNKLSTWPFNRSLIARFVTILMVLLSGSGILILEMSGLR